MKNEKPLTLEVLHTANPALSDFFQNKLEEFNLDRWEVKEKVPIFIKAEDENNNILAGAAGKTFGLWLLIDNIWVDEKLRGQNMGTKILEKLESEAIKRGCHFALLDTLNFQAKPFYEKFGYTVKWTQPQYPKDGCKHFMVKKLI